MKPQLEALLNSLKDVLSDATITYAEKRELGVKINALIDDARMPKYPGLLFPVIMEEDEPENINRKFLEPWPS